MNRKVMKLREEQEKNREKIAVLQGRNRDIERQITELENSDILELVHSHDLNITQLAALIHTMRTDPAVALRGETKEEPDHEEI